LFPKNSPILGLNIGEISGKFWGIGPQMVPWKKVPNYVYWDVVCIYVLSILPEIYEKLRSDFDNFDFI